MNLQELEDFEETHRNQLPDLVIVRKAYPKTRKRQNKRIWKLKRMNMEQKEDNIHDRKKKKNAENVGDKDMVDFMNDIEEDPEMRANILLYKVSSFIANIIGSRCNFSA